MGKKDTLHVNYFGIVYQINIYDFFRYLIGIINGDHPDIIDVYGKAICRINYDVSAIEKNEAITEMKTYLKIEDEDISTFIRHFATKQEKKILKQIKANNEA